MWEKHYTPPPPKPPHIWDTKSEQGNRGYNGYIDSNCPHLLFGETTSHLIFQPVSEGALFNIIFFNVENNIKREMRKNCFSKKKIQHPPPPPWIFLFTPIFFNVGNSMKREENMKFWRKKIIKILFFSIFTKFIKNSNNIPSISKTIQHTPMTWCTYLQSFEKIQQCVFELQCEN